MKVTIVEVGLVPEPLQAQFSPYRTMFASMFTSTGMDFDHEVVGVLDGQPLPDPATLEGIAITGSAAGVYEDHAWLEPLREFIRQAYAVRTPMLGICFGHQVMADALGGVVRKSEKGWGLGRHRYGVVSRPPFMADAPDVLEIACSHQDQVVVAPPEAEVILASDFTPNAGLFYKSGAALSFQPHPEFEDDYTLALAEMRRGVAPDGLLEQAVTSLERPSDSELLRGYIGRFMQGARRAAQA